MGKKRNPSNHGRFVDKNRDHCVAINITIPQKLLNNVEQNVDGESRSAKIVSCVKAGYPSVTNANAVII
jgi:hypothetical protein